MQNRSSRSPNWGGQSVNVQLPPFLPKLIAVAVVVFAVAVIGAASSYIIEPGTRGVKITLGKAADDFLPEGFGFRTPFITRIVPVLIKQRTVPLRADCFSSDLQQVTVEVRVLYRIPEKSVVQIYRQYAGDPFDSLIAPRVQEALKEVTALMTAEQIVKRRDEVKEKSITAARVKIGEILSVEDIVVRDIQLSKELETAIEAKMVAEQEAARARFTQLQTQVEADTAVIRAEGEAKAIRIRGEALKLNPAYLRLQIVEKWNGRSPLVVPSDAGGAGPNLLLPLGSGADSTRP
ncbi:MAG TPA: prohibitin family protein [Verrucomicrobiota bacterium]|nr:prohibitin family protein [Verrucomicrobiota bacterium]